MPDTFAITIASIIVFTVITAFIKGRSRDKCLMDFSGDMVTLEEKSGKAIWGKLSVEHTGLELVYLERHKDKKGHDETSYILYKQEYPGIQALVRFHNRLTEDRKRQREKELKRTYHPGALRRLNRKIHSFFKTVKDSLMDIMNMVIGRVKNTPMAGGVLTSQDKYVSQLKQEVMGSLGTSYEPLLERHIGRKVVLELIKTDKRFEYSGVLKDYTAEFIEIMDVDYCLAGDQNLRKADLVVPRQCGRIRHLGE